MNLLRQHNISHILAANPQLSSDIAKVERILRDDPTYLFLCSRGFDLFWKGHFDRTIEIKCTRRGQGKVKAFARSMKNGTHRLQ